MFVVVVLDEKNISTLSEGIDNYKEAERIFFEYAQRGDVHLVTLCNQFGDTYKTFIDYQKEPDERRISK